MRILVAGDPHGFEGLKRINAWATLERVAKIVVLGDVWDTSVEMVVPTHFIRGNHEIEARWDGTIIPAKNVLLHQDYEVLNLDGKRVGVLGRMDEEAHAHLLEKGWWLGEASNRSFTKRGDASQVFVGCELMLFHDSPYPFLYGDGIGGSRFLGDLVNTVQPRLALHGHAHRYQERLIGETQTIGMPLTGDPSAVAVHGTGYMVLETDDWSYNVRLFGPLPTAQHQPPWF